MFVVLDNEPAPLCVQATVPFADDAAVLLEPNEKVGVPSQTSALLPAMAIGAGTIFTDMVEVTKGQLPLLLPRSVKVTFPVSVAEAKYVGASVLALNRVPAPLWVHKTELTFNADAGVDCVLKLNVAP